MVCIRRPFLFSKLSRSGIHDKMKDTNGQVFPDSKTHFESLDALRGIAAILVVIFHVFEIFSGGDHTKQMLNHGYLAVDFFFMLSGFVIGHAYDDRWSGMTLKDFFKRRLIRLHPMIIAGMIIGAVCFYFSASEVLFPPIAETPVWKVILYMLVGFTLLPVPVSMDIRGWGEMHPLNGPAWSLFFEYIANILYAIFLRRLSTRILSALALLAGINLIWFAVSNPNGDVIGGWSIIPEQLYVGFTRLLFPFLAGLVLSRIFKPFKIRYAFLLSSALLIVLLVIPRVGGTENPWMNGLYDSLTIIFLFPLIILIGASGEPAQKFRLVSRFLGDISYPLYMVHFPFAYIFYAWVVNNGISLSEALPYGLLLLVFSIGLSYAVFRFYDVPVRKWLNRRLMSKSYNS